MKTERWSIEGLELWELRHSHTPTLKYSHAPNNYTDLAGARE